jgi:hypothetical protein
MVGNIWNSADHRTQVLLTRRGRSNIVVQGRMEV